jgi:hypothetical protein
VTAVEELWVSRDRLLERHAAQVDALQSVLDGIPVRRLRLSPPDGGWSAHQRAVHVRDVETQAYVPRVHRMLAEEDPRLVDFDAEAFMGEHYSSVEPAAQIVQDVVQARQGVRRVLAFDDARAWSRTGRHPALGVCTLQAWVERAVAHLEEHLEQLEGLRHAVRPRAHVTEGEVSSG